MTDDVERDAFHVVVTGPMGVGKSSTAERLAADLDRRVVDSDVDLERLFGRTGRMIAEEHGVDELHRLEAAVLLGALASDEPSVISAAASAVEDPWCRDALARRAVTVVLSIDTPSLVERASGGGHRRSIDRDETDVLAERRGPLLDRVADMTVDASAPLEDVVGEILDEIG